MRASSGLSARSPYPMSTAPLTKVVWFLTNLPSLVPHMPPSVSGPLILLVAGAVLLVGCVRLPREDRLPVGLLGGLVAGLVNLLAFGTRLTDRAAPGVEGLVPNAALLVVGFLTAMCVTGLVAGFGARSLGGIRHRRTVRSWLASFAVVNAVAILPLIALGGLVTSAKAGMAVPDWPGTYGANMFLYPISLMSEPRILLEHSHRLFGAMVGLTTVVGFIFAICAAPKTWMKLAALGLLVLVIAQGIAGALRVLETSRAFAIVHAITGQVFFALMCAYAAGVSEKWALWKADAAARITAPTPRKGIITLLCLLFVQLVMGTMVRHPGEKNSLHALYTHGTLSLVILVLAIIVGTKMMGLKKKAPEHGRSLWFAGHHVVGAVGLQFLLGWIALIAWMANKEQPIVSPTADQLAGAEAIRPLNVLIRTAHQANGALLFGMSAVMAVWGLVKAEAVSRKA